jgi:hypothetical protein
MSLKLIMEEIENEMDRDGPGLHEIVGFCDHSDESSSYMAEVLNLWSADRWESVTPTQRVQQFRLDN